MKIIIAGAGEMGTHLAKLLSRERHTITLMDGNEEQLAPLSQNFDILTLPLRPTSINALRQAETGRADLFIGVTPEEGTNMTCCMLAKGLGVKRTVARVNNYEYTLPENADFFRSVGIDSVIYPERLVGEEIADALERSWVRQWWEVKGGVLVMIGVKVRETAHILGIPLKDLSKPETPYHIVAIKRGAGTLIPHGFDTIEAGDIVYFMTFPQEAEYIRQICGKEEYPDMKSVFFMGGGSVAVHAVNNIPQSVKVKIIESSASACEHLSQVLRRDNTLIIHGDARDIDLLIEEGISRAQAFAALTDNSETNILACLTAKRLGIHKTVAIIENTDYVNMAEGLDIGSIINKKAFAAGHIHKMLLKTDDATVKCLTVANAYVAELVVSAGAKVTKRLVKDLSLPLEVTLGGLVRNGKGMLITGGTQIREGDTVMAFCLGDAVARLAKYF